MKKIETKNYHATVPLRRGGVIPVQSFGSHIRPQPSGLGLSAIMDYRYRYLLNQQRGNVPVKWNLYKIICTNRQVGMKNSGAAPCCTVRSHGVSETIATIAVLHLSKALDAFVTDHQYSAEKNPPSFHYISEGASAAHFKHLRNAALLQLKFRSW